MLSQLLERKHHERVAAQKSEGKPEGYYIDCFQQPRVQKGYVIMRGDHKMPTNSVVWNRELIKLHQLPAQEDNESITGHMLLQSVKGKQPLNACVIDCVTNLNRQFLIFDDWKSRHEDASIKRYFCFGTVYTDVHGRKFVRNFSYIPAGVSGMWVNSPYCLDFPMKRNFYALCYKG